MGRFGCQCHGRKGYKHGIDCLDPLDGRAQRVKLSDAGSGQGYFKLDGSNLPASYTPADIRRANAEMLEMTEPGFAEVIIYRNEIPLLSGHGEVI